MCTATGVRPAPSPTFTPSMPPRERCACTPACAPKDSSSTVTASTPSTPKPESSPPNARSSCLSRTRTARFTPWQTRGPAGRQRARVHRQGPRRVSLPARSACRLHRSRKTDPKPVRRELHVSLLSLRMASTAMSTSTNTGLPASRMPGASSTLGAGTTTPYDLTAH